MADILRVTQVGAETALTDNPPGRVTQVGVELLYHEPVPMRVTQVGVEVLWTPGPPVGGGLVGTGINPGVGDGICGAENPLPFVLWRLN